MSKFKKKSKKAPKPKKISEDKISDDKFAFRTVIISAIIGGIFLVLSFFFNATDWFYEGIIINYVDKEVYWDVLDISIKVSVILLGFLFMMISIGNYKELTGKPVNLIEILLLVGLTLAQTFRNLYVFVFTLIGLAVILFYLYMVQESPY